MLSKTSRINMSITSSSTSQTKRPVIVKVPVPDKARDFSLRKAERYLRGQGARPLTRGESDRYKHLRCQP